MYAKENFTPAARAALIRAHFHKFSMKCGNVTKQIDADLPAAQLAEMRKQADDLVDLLQKMLARTCTVARQ